MPVASAKSSASATAAAFAAPRELLISFRISPCPSAPTWTISSPPASSSGRARSKSPRSPPTMIVSVPSAARGEDPVTGASIIAAPRAASAAPIRRVSGGAIVEQSTNSRPRRAASIAPPSPSSTDSTWAPSTTIETTISLAAATSAGVSCDLAPCSAAQAAALPGVWVHTASSKPARATLAAIREPMMPRPRKPMGSPWGAIAESSPTGRFDAQPLPGRQRPGGLARELPAVEQVTAGQSVGAAPRPPGAVTAALGDQGEGHLPQRLELPHHAVAASPGPCSSGSAPPRVLEGAQREFPLERLDRGVQRVAHRHVHPARAVGIRAGSLAPAERLVVGEALVSHAHVVHRALPLRHPEGAHHHARHPR